MSNIAKIIHPSWHIHLQPLFDNSKMDLIKNQLLPNCTFYPEAEYIFRVFSMPVSNIKVVILGQDPYFNGSAIGYAFAVNEKSPYPKSLDVILKEVLRPQTSEEYVKFKVENPEWKTLQHWVQQGVFLLNTALTVEIGKAGSHLGQWQWFIREVIKVISQEVKPVWLLWGSKAQSYRDYIYGASTIKNIGGDTSKIVSLVDVQGKNHILEAYHPAAGAYSGGKNTFEGCNHFNICNEILKLKEENIINW
jgi:uracil-DNA glycosylase